MSKMPAKKKSCFQITSVTQAQVAASSATDDTESLDDPDEARTEEGSSEIFDVSRADYEPVCDRSSSEEAINNVGETDAPGVMVPQHIPQVNQLSALPNNPNGGSRNIGYACSASSSQQGHDPGAALMSALVTQPGPVQQQRLPPGVSVGGGPPSLSVNVSHAAPVTYSTPSSTTATVSCSSRFRVIKLDHGTGEPFRRGRWTCTEFYEKDSEGSVMGRSVDNIRHANAAPDPSLDRDSGLGHIGGSAVIPATNFGQGLGSLADMMLLLPASRMQTLDALQQQMHQAAYATGQPGGTASQNAFSSSIKSIAVSTPQQPAVGLLQPSVGHSSLSQGGVNMQKTALSQPAGQASAATSSQTEYYHQQQQLHASPMQEAPPTSLTLAQSGRQGPSPIITQMLGRTAASGQSGEMAGPGGGGALPVLSAPSLLPPPPGGGLGGVGGSLLLGGSALQQAGGQYTSPGQLQPHNLEHAPSGGQNVPAASSSVPTTVPTGAPSASSAAMPNLMTSSLLMAKQAQFSRGQLGAFGVFGALVPGKDLMKPLIPESLHLSSPTVRSLFGIPLPMDGEEDSASGTSVVAIDNKIEQAMDLVKSHLMYAVREEVEVLKEQIKELLERNSVLERENVVLKSISNTDQLSQLSTPPASCAGGTPPQQPGLGQAQAQHQSQSHSQLQHPHSAPQTQSPQTQPPQTQPPQTQPPQTQPPQNQSPQTQPHLDPSQPPQPKFTSA
ncbi:TSC22 domain family protein 2-like isoform X1 [Gadus chalcogrammus]|uniref:TSC22 domain family protein 2-like isoform X1 n=1 Tax=Gadus chalcogrammus TaxID=1042646 RepID=UPI0024C49F50|nr:TSC22 domain family protein 2-like isoform X1 [Gadus chalcogrammus]